MVFGEITIDGLTVTSALISATSEADSRKNRLLALQTILNERLPPDFRLMVANGHLETTGATAELQVEVGVILLKERSIVMTNLTSPIFGFFSTKKQHYFRHASRSTHFLFLIHATQAYRQHVLQH